jgi:hypothetical protein
MTARRTIPASSIGVPKSADFAVTHDLAEDLLVATAALTVTLPTPGALGNGFQCDIVNDSGGNVVIDGPAVTNVTLADGHIATIYESDYKQRVVNLATTVVGDRFTADTPWDPSVFGLDYDLVHWWDASQGVLLDDTSGLVRHWSDVIGGVDAKQTGLIHQPSWQNSDEVRFDGSGLGLVIPTEGRAGYESKWWLMLFRVNWTAMAVSGAVDSSFFALNGPSSSNGQKQPQFTYLRATHEVVINWYTNSGVVSLTMPIPGADDTWHSLLCRRTDDHIYASVDGAAESSLACYPRGFVQTGFSGTGWIGNGSGTVHQVMSIGIDTLLWGQRDISSDEIAAAHAWALWKRGAEASLDASSPYLAAAPLMSLADQHVAPQDSYADGYRFPPGGSLPTVGWDDTVLGDALNLSGFTRTFHDHFTSISTVTDGLVGAGSNWYAPAHIDTSPAKFRSPIQTPLDTFTLLPDNTTLQIKCQKFVPSDPLSKLYCSGHMQTVDVWRNGGFTQAVPIGGASYFEARLALNAKGLDVDGNIVEPAPAWNAFWLYTVLDAKDSAATKAELDVMETYGDRDPSIFEIHNTAHLHTAYRPQPGNGGSVGNSVFTRTPTKITNVTNSPFNVSPSLFDGQGEGLPGTFHTYGLMVDETWMTWYFDGKAVSRFATFKEALGPLFMIVSMQTLQLDPLGIPGQGGGTPDCETYMWVDYVDAYSHA